MITPFEFAMVLLAIALGIFQVTFLLPRTFEKHCKTVNERAFVILENLIVMSVMIILGILFGLDMFYGSVFALSFAITLILASPLKVVNK